MHTIALRRSALAALLVAACAAPSDRHADSSTGDTARRSTVAPRADTSRRSTGAPRGDAAPVFELALWPGEGIPVVEAVADTLVLRAEPSTAAAIAAVARMRRGTRVEFDSTRYRTMSAAPLRVLAPATVRGRWFGAVRSLSRDQYASRERRDTSISVAAHTPIELLQHRAEGSCFVRVAGNVVESAECPSLDATHFAASGEPVTEWWIHVTSADASGWLEVDDRAARVARRTF